jgi:hypothetical protein
LDWTALALAIGLAGLMLVSTALGFLSLYYPIAAWVVLGSISIILLSRKLQDVWRFSNGDQQRWTSRSAELRLLAWGLAIIMICGVGAYMWALAPAVRWDSLSYHIPVPLHFIRQHAISELPESLQSYWAHYAETLYTLGMLIEPSTSLPGLLHYELGLVTTLLTFVLDANRAVLSKGY